MWTEIKRSSASDEEGTKICDCRMPSICVTAFKKPSCVNLAFPITRFRWYLKDLTPACQRSPKLGELGEINSQLTPSLLKIKKSHCQKFPLNYVIC